MIRRSVGASGAVRAAPLFADQHFDYFGNVSDSLRRPILRILKLRRRPAGALSATVSVADDGNNLYTGLFPHHAIREGTGFGPATVDHQSRGLQVKLPEQRFRFHHGSRRKGSNLALAELLRQSEHEAQIAIQHEDSGRRIVLRHALCS